MSTPTPKYFKAWIIFFLIATVGGLILGGGIGAILGFGMGIARIDMGTIKLVCGIAGFLIGLPLSYFTFRWAVGEFIVKPLTPEPPPPVIPPPTTVS